MFGLQTQEVISIVDNISSLILIMMISTGNLILKRWDYMMFLLYLSSSIDSTNQKWHILVIHKELHKQSLEVLIENQFTKKESTNSFY